MEGPCSKSALSPAHHSPASLYSASYPGALKMRPNCLPEMIKRRVWTLPHLRLHELNARVSPYDDMMKCLNPSPQADSIFGLKPHDSQSLKTGECLSGVMLAANAACSGASPFAWHRTSSDSQVPDAVGRLFPCFLPRLIPSCVEGDSSCMSVNTRAYRLSYPQLRSQPINSRLSVGPQSTFTMMCWRWTNRVWEIRHLKIVLFLGTFVEGRDFGVIILGGGAGLMEEALDLDIKFPPLHLLEYRIETVANVHIELDPTFSYSRPKTLMLALWILI